MKLFIFLLIVMHAASIFVGGSGAAARSKAFEFLAMLQDSAAVERSPASTQASPPPLMKLNSYKRVTKKNPASQKTLPSPEMPE
jgi:hypothetical protein